ncbi:hypothetical protein [Frondihabitans cladoniiphilus]|uniref:DUF1109 domain-containing protein n=1 Tax=Frondihabitans cladoniiphilus TaxID=715785 RepID=A0ABP8VRW7_9MICO
MTGLDRRLVDAAVSLSPAAHRDTRREQWLADLDGADELGLSSLRLGMGAFTTALFHHRATHRSTWEDSPMTTVPVTGHHRVPHTLRTESVLIALAFLSMFVGALLLILLGRYGGTPLSRTFYLAVDGVIAGIPGLLFMGALGLSEGGTRRRRSLAMGMTVLLTVLFGSYVVGFGRMFAPDWLIIGVVVAGSVFVWLFARGHRGRVWLVTLLPVLVLCAARSAQEFAFSDLNAPAAVLAFTYWMLNLVPFGACAVAALLAGRISSRSRTAAAPVSLTGRSGEPTS